MACTTGSRNVAIGHIALLATSTGGGASGHIAIGAETLKAKTTDYGAGQNIAVGDNAMTTCTTGYRNTAVGGLHEGGQGCLKLVTTGNYNCAFGLAAGYNITTASNNVAIGSFAMATATTGIDNICIGYSADVSASSSTDQIVMGNGVTGNANDSFVIGNGTTDSAIAFGGTSVTAPSDIRLKEDIQDEVVGLDFINQLRPVTFRWKKEKDVPEELVTYKADSEERVMNGKYNHGFIAQEVKEVIDNTPDIKEGFDMWSEDDADGRQRIGEGALIPMLTKAVQELWAKVEDLVDKLNNKE